MLLLKVKYPKLYLMTSNKEGNGVTKLPVNNAGGIIWLVKRKNMSCIGGII